MSRAAGVRLKFERSRHHTAQLERAIHDYLEQQPFAVYETEEEETGDLVYRVKVRKTPPTELSLLLGDAIHNARAALDYLAWQLVIAGGGIPGTLTAFPISKSEKEFNKSYQAKLKGSSQEALAAVQALRPFSGGDERFWRLHGLDIEDKHHLLVAVGAAHRSVNVSFEVPGIEPVVLPLNPSDRAYPLRDGTEVFRVMRAARESAEQGVGGANSFDFEVAFGEAGIVSGEPIIPTLSDLITGVESAVAPLFALLE
ncbi:hypothetical protein AB0D89_32925 [Streptomyces luteogriseus]|uniref:hypothetical protein n=1 Tax=Streptomyces luteogriseus TaxID=68233 RepID=UPI0033F9E94C